MHVRRLMLASSVSLSVALIMVFALVGTALAALPDNRAFEMVSPIEKGGESNMPNLAVASANGEHVVVDGGVANSLLSSDVSWMIENRTPTGWGGTQVGPGPGHEAENRIEQDSIALAAVSENFSSFAFQTLIGLDPRDRNSPPGVQTEFFGRIAENVPSSDVYVGNGAARPFLWASGPPAPMVKSAELPSECHTEGIYCAENNAVFGGGSADLSVVVWSQLNPPVAPPAALPGSPADTHQYGSEVYESTNGTDQQLVGLVPSSGTECGPSHSACVVPPCGAALGNAPGRKHVFGNSFAPTEGDVSSDGSQVVFTSPEPSVEEEPGCTPGEIYVREGGTSTVQASGSQRAGGDPHGPRSKRYAGAAQEGGKIDTVFFTSSEELTNNANTGSEDEGNDLYAYSLKSGALTDITPDSNPADVNGAGVISFIGSSTDGSIVYFTATGALTSEPNGQGETAQSGVSNLYVYNANTGTTRFIVPGNGVEGTRSQRTANLMGYNMTSEVTPDGRHLVFRTSEHVTSYDNVGSGCGGPCAEVYLYSETGNRVVCVSCDPSGAPPASSASLPLEFRTYSDELEDPSTLALPVAVSENGERVFFNSPDQLTADAPVPAPGKFNGGSSITGEGSVELNVYEYEGGHVYLIAPAAALSTITPSGNDVFFYTDAQLVPQDRDGTLDIYDARVDGGFPALAAPQCSGTSCQGTPAPAPIFATPPSTTFNGVGNFPAPVSSGMAAKKTKKKIKKKVLRAKGKRKTSKRARRSRTRSTRGSRR